MLALQLSDGIGIGDVLKIAAVGDHVECTDTHDVLVDLFAVEHPGWRLAVMEGLGHLPMLEAPRRTADLVAEWWAGVDPPR